MKVRFDKINACINIWIYSEKGINLFNYYAVLRIRHWNISNVMHQY